MSSGGQASSLLMKSVLALLPVAGPEQGSMPASVSPLLCSLLLVSRNNALQVGPTFRVLDDNMELHQGGPSVVGSWAGRGQSRPMGWGRYEKAQMA